MKTNDVFAPMETQRKIHFISRRLASTADRFLWLMKPRMNETNFPQCFVCFLLNAAYCEAHDTLDNLCAMIPGDAPQYSMFRRDAQPMECPFKGSFTYTYSRGHGECRSPVSRLDSCSESWRIFFRYQACPDVQGTESSGNISISLESALASALPPFD